MSWLATATQSAIGFGGGYGASALINRRAVNKEAEAAVRQAVTADWSAYVGRIQDRLEQVEERLDAAEKAASKLPVALSYIRQIAEWVQKMLPGHAMPPAPPELEADL